MLPPILLAAIITTTPLATINPTHQEAVMAQGNQGNQGQGNLSFPPRQPRQPFHPDPTRYAAPGPGHRSAAHGYPNNGQNRIAGLGQGITPTEHTNRPR